jgi:phthalate 4,5-dioxygenase
MSSAFTRKRDEQMLISRIEGAAPAGQMLRRYWHPALLSEEVAERDGPPVRVRLFGQDYVAFRDSNGEVGLLDAACPHRLASLGLGRNEEGGLRCIYHGWKFDVRGRCVDMPTEPPDSTFAQRLRTGAYAVREAGGFVWAYLGPPELEPAFPAFDWTGLPRNQIALLKFVQNTNWLQAVEGSIDTIHTRILHRGMLATIPGLQNQEAMRDQLTSDATPRLETVDTSYGFRYAAIQKPNLDAGKFKVVKVTRFVFPMTTVTSKQLQAQRAVDLIFVPIDDMHTMSYSVWHTLDGSPIDEQAERERACLVPGIDLDAAWRPHAKLENWYQQDREAMKNGSWTGIRSLLVQDAACEETMGAFTDHTREHLGTTDVAIIRLRRRMLESVRCFLAGDPPIGLGTPIDYALLDHVDFGLIGIDERWQDLQTFPGEYVADEPATIGAAS